MITSRTWLVLLAACLSSSAGYAQTKICIGNVSGGDASTFNIQQPLFKAVATEAAARGDKVTPQLMTASNEKSAKDEMSSLKCDFALMSNISREWPQPKGGMKTGTADDGKGGKDDNPHPPSTARFHFNLLDKKGKRLDKLETTVEMQIRYTAKDVETEVQQILQEVANWTLDGTIANK